MAVAFVACVMEWFMTDHFGYLIAGVGFLILAPVWYQAPITWAFFSGPIGLNFKNPGKLSMINSVLSLVGYPMLCIGGGLLLFQ